MNKKYTLTIREGFPKKGFWSYTVISIQKMGGSFIDCAGEQCICKCGIGGSIRQLSRIMTLPFRLQQHCLCYVHTVMCILYTLYTCTHSNWNWNMWTCQFKWSWFWISDSELDSYNEWSCEWRCLPCGQVLGVLPGAVQSRPSLQHLYLNWLRLLLLPGYQEQGIAQPVS